MEFYAPGTRIAGRYEVAGRPLIGGMGIVYVCLDHQEDRPVALKTFKPEFLPDRTARDRFLREGTHWVDLGQHPHIVRCYDVLYIDPEMYLVLELVAKEPDRDGASLRAWLTPGQPLPPDQALLFALQIARGMGHAAATLPGFVHRDLKPENVLVGADKMSGVNRLRVTDFGLAAVLQGMDLQPSEGSAGTPLYMAPEQWQGEAVGVYTDAYALGCILYEMVSGQQAVAGESLSAIQRAHCEGDLRPLPPDLPELLRAFLTRCLALAPEKRYGDWAQVEAALTTAYETLADRSAPAAVAAADLSRKERVAAGWSYNTLGNAYRDIGKAEMAVGYFERARSVGSAEGARALEGAALGNLGNAYADLGDARRAMGYFEQRLDMAREIGAASGSAAERMAARRGEANALMGLGLAHADLGDARRAIEYYEQSLTIHREIGAASRSAAERMAARRGAGIVLGNLGSAYLNLGDARRAIEYYEQRLEIAREIGATERTADRRGEGTVLGNLGSAYLQLGDTRRATEYYAQHLDIAREVGDRRGEGHALGNLGNAYLQLGDARRALGYYEQRLDIAREVGDRCGEGNALMGLGLAYAALDDARHAIECYEQCLSIHREIGDRREEANALGNLGSAHLKLGDARRAMDYYEQALAMDREIGDIAGVAADSFNMARLYAQQGEKTRALELAQEAAHIYSQIGHAQYAQYAQKLITQLQGGGTPRHGSSRDQVLQQFDQIIEAVVAAAHGHRQARAAVEGLFDQFERGNWRIVGPIQRIWAGERDAGTLTAGIDSNSALIVREILRRLGA